MKKVWGEEAALASKALAGTESEKERGYWGNILRKHSRLCVLSSYSTPHILRSPLSTESCGHCRRTRDRPGYISGCQVGLGAASGDDQSHK